jgi:hypothetical protein
MSSMPRLGIFPQKFTVALSYRLGALPVSTIFLLDFGIVQTMWYIFTFQIIIYHYIDWHYVFMYVFWDNVITPTLNIPTIITPILNTSTVTDSLCNSGAFSNDDLITWKGIHIGHVFFLSWILRKIWRESKKQTNQRKHFY